MSTTSHQTVTRWFHWLVAAAVIPMLIFGFFMGDLPKDMQGPVYFFHKSSGLMLLSVMLLRSLWALFLRYPAYPAWIPTWQIKLARMVHVSFYVLLIAMPISGWIMSTAAGHIPSFFGLFSAPAPGIPVDETLAKTAAELHKFIAISLLILLGPHVFAAIWHHSVDKEFLYRMLPTKKNRSF